MGQVPVSLRLIVQRVPGNPGSSSRYRLVAYGDHGNYQPVTFDSLQKLREAFQRAIPEFKPDRLRETSEDPSASSIILAELMDLTDQQLSLLGLRNDRDGAPARK